MKFNFSIPSINFASIGNIHQTAKFLQMKEQVNSQKGDPHFRGTYADDPQNITNKDYQKIVPIPDKVKQDLMNAIKETMETTGRMREANERDPISKVKQQYINSLPKAERSSAGWTFSQIQFEEVERLRDFVKAKDPSWDWGKPVKPEILAEAYKSPNIDIKA